MKTTRVTTSSASHGLSPYLQNEAYISERAVNTLRLFLFWGNNKKSRDVFGLEIEDTSVTISISQPFPRSQNQPKASSDENLYRRKHNNIGKYVRIIERILGEEQLRGWIV